MRKAILVLVLALGTVTTVHASTTTLTASPTSSTVGQKVTFTAKFTPSCTGTVASYYFTIDGKRYNGTYTRSGLNRTEVLAISTLAAGTHSIAYQWTITATCKGSASLSYTVAATPSPTPTPTPTPSPSPAPSPSPSPSPTPVTLTAAETPPDEPIGYFGGALMVLAVVAGLALALLSRR